MVYICGMIRTAIKGLVDMLLPRLCPVCGRATEHSPLCAGCLVALPRCDYQECRQRLLPLLDAAVCPPGVVASWTPYRHDSPGGLLIRNMKYHHRPRSGFEMGRIFASELCASDFFAANGLPAPAGIDVLLPVPLHWTKMLHRGFNQSRAVALGMAEVLGARVADNLVAIKGHGTQTHKSAAERVANIKGSFGVVDAHALDGLHVAIVDDVITTGATMTECILALGRSGAQPASLSLLSLGLVPK